MQRQDRSFLGLQSCERILRFGNEALGDQSLDPQQPAPVGGAVPLIERAGRAERSVVRTGRQQRVAIVQNGVGFGMNDPRAQRGAQEVDDRTGLRGLLEDRGQRHGEVRVPLSRRVGGLVLLIGGVKAHHRFARLSSGQFEHASPLEDFGVVPAALDLSDLANRLLGAGQEAVSRGIRNGQRKNPLDATSRQQRAERQAIDTPGRLRRAGRVLRVRQLQRPVRQVDHGLKGRCVLVDRGFPVLIAGRQDRVLGVFRVKRSRLPGGDDRFVELVPGRCRVEVRREERKELGLGCVGLRAGRKPLGHGVVLGLQGLHLFSRLGDRPPLDDIEFSRQNVDVRLGGIARGAQSLGQDLVRLLLGLALFVAVADRRGDLAPHHEDLG